MNYYKRYPGDYRRDTGHLSLAEHGAYTLLLDWYYGNDGSLPGDMPTLYRICSAVTAAERLAIRSVIGQFFRPENGRFVNARAEEELATEKPRIEAAKSNGSRGGRPKRKPTGLSDENPLGYTHETHWGSKTKSSPYSSITPIPGSKPETKVAQPTPARFVNGTEDENHTAGFERHYREKPDNSAPARNRRAVEERDAKTGRTFDAEPEPAPR